MHARSSNIAASGESACAQPKGYGPPRGAARRVHTAMVPRAAGAQVAQVRSIGWKADGSASGARRSAQSTTSAAITIGAYTGALLECEVRPKKTIMQRLNNPHPPQQNDATARRGIFLGWQPTLQSSTNSGRVSDVALLSCRKRKKHAKQALDL